MNNTKYRLLIGSALIVLLIIITMTYLIKNDKNSKNHISPTPLITNAPRGTDIEKLRDVPLVKNANQQLPAIKNKIQNNPRDVSSLKQAAQIYNMNGDFENAILYYKQAIEIDDSNYELFNNIGDVYIEKGDVQLAVEVYNKSIDLKPTNNPAYINLANLYELKSRDIVSAIKVYEKAVAMDKNNIDLLLLLASSYLKNSQKNKAVDVYQSILILDPTNQSALKAVELNH